MSLNVKVMDKNALYTPITYPRQRRNGTRSLQVTSLSSRPDHSVVSRGWFWRHACGLFGKTFLALVCLWMKRLGNHWTDLCQIHMENVWSHTQTSLNVPTGSDGMDGSAAWRIVTRSLQTTSRSSRRDHFVSTGWERFRRPACSLFGRTSLALILNDSYGRLTLYLKIYTPK